MNIVEKIFAPPPDKVTIVCQAGDKSEGGSYTPLSVISTIAEIFEKLISSD